MFDLKNLNPVHRFFYEESEEEWIELRQIPESVVQGFRKDLGIKQKRMREFNKSGNPVYVDLL